MQALGKWALAVAAAAAAALAACGQQGSSTASGMAAPAPTGAPEASPSAPAGASAAVPTALSAPASSPGSYSEADICGQYYFKGIKLMEVRREGASIVSELRGEAEFLAGGLSGEQGPQTPKPGAGHRGRPLGPAQVEFADFDLSPQAFLKHLSKTTGVSAPPEMSPEMEAAKGGLAKASGRYFERWRLLPGGRLQMECGLPILSLSVGPHMAEQLETMRKVKEGWACGQYQKICGWKILDPREAEAWQALDAEDFARAAQLFHAAAEAQPDRPFPCLGEAWALMGAKQFDRAREALNAGVARLSDETRPFLEQFAFNLKDQIYSYETVALGQDFNALIEQIEEKIPLVVEPELSKKSARELTPADYQQIASILNACEFLGQTDQGVGLRGRGMLMPIGQKGMSMKTYAEMKMPNFLKLQDLAKIYRLRGHFQRAPGQKRYSEAVRSYASAIRMGQLMRHGPLMSHLIGIASEAIGVSGLEQMLEDGLVADPQVFQTFQQFVTFLDQEEPRLQPWEILSGEFGGGHAFISDPLIEWMLLTLAMPNCLEAETRAKMPTARLAMLKAACALKSQKPQGPYAQGLDPAALPQDPFVPAQKLRSRAEGGAAIFHSLGPDQQDQQSAVAYDPTNGTLSAGDVILTVK